MIITDTVKKTKLDYVLTAVSPNFPRRPQLDAIFKWLPAIGTVVVSGHVTPIANPNGVEFHQSENPSAKLQEMLQAWFARNPFDSVVGICKPTVVISNNVSQVFEFMERAGTGKAWVFYSRGPVASQPPELFVTTKVVLEHLVKSVPSDLTLEGDEWSVWLEQWFVRNMPIHRFVDATKFELVSERVPIPREPPSIIGVNSLLEDTLNQIAPHRTWARNTLNPRSAAPEIETPVKIDADGPDFDAAPISPVIEVKVAKKRGRPSKASKAAQAAK